MSAPQRESDIELRRATEDDTSALTKIARAAKRHWGYPERWLEEWEPILTIDATTLAGQTVIVAIKGRELVGFFGLTMGASSCSLDHLWVDPEHHGYGVGKTLFQYAVAEARRGGARSLRIESDPNTERFYEKMGARRVGQVSAPVGGEARHLPVLELDIT